ncbi:hypothetical protein Q2363_27040, partial [Escherichia coli]|nr:hypothetical protein [Escherichia coli]
QHKEMLISRLKYIKDDDVSHVSSLEIKLAEVLGFETKRLIDKRTAFFKKREVEEENRHSERHNKKIEAEINYN